MGAQRYNWVSTDKYQVWLAHYNSWLWVVTLVIVGYPAELHQFENVEDGGPPIFGTLVCVVVDHDLAVGTVCEEFYQAGVDENCSH